MPSHEIKRLSDLCLKNVAVNVVHHATMLNEIPPEGEIFTNYKVFQFLFSDDLLRELEYIYRSDVDNMPTNYNYTYAPKSKPTSCLDELMMFLFRGKICHTSRILWPCLKFLFHEHTREVSLRFPVVYPRVEEVPELFFKALSFCKNIKCLKFQFCSFPDERLLRCTSWGSLMKLDLLLSLSTDSVIVHALKNCPDLRELKASGNDVTNECLFSLCTETLKTAAAKFHFCDAEGMCCSLGKKVKKLVLYGTQITENGIACALQHLPLVKEFLEGPLGRNDEDRHLVAPAVSLLKKACRFHKRPFRTLKLNTIIYDNFINPSLLDDVEGCCPFMDTKVFYPSLQVCYSRCQETFSASLSHFPLNGIELPFSSFMSLWNKPVKHFFFIGAYLYFIRDEAEFQPSLPGQYFLGVHFKPLILDGEFEEERLMLPVKLRDFNSLEHISISFVDLGGISFLNLIRRATKLKKITYFGCKNAKKFVVRHKRYVRKHNFQLDICVGERSPCIGTEIKLNMI